eukprot:TRINITY_DN31286_c0_g1_i3.p1 TRINITY_DN31286_c0_g1~~TRINITY_DN31286_c0_g1_i3.p1  ORF type:complete len:470 (+),score=66.24 TRINITY_DN31286_c0_g1_i3:918-2327(+)
MLSGPETEEAPSGAEFVKDIELFGRCGEDAVALPLAGPLRFTRDSAGAPCVVAQLTERLPVAQYRLCLATPGAETEERRWVLEGSIDPDDPGSWVVLSADTERGDGSRKEGWTPLLQLGATGRCSLVMRLMRRQGLTPDVRIWNMMLTACKNAGDPDYAEALLAEMKAAGVQPDRYTWGVMILVHAAAARSPAGMRRAEELFAEARKAGDSSAPIFTNLLTGWGNIAMRSPKVMRVRRGIVKNWDQNGRFGFIAPSAGGEDVFVPHGALVGMAPLRSRRAALIPGEVAYYSPTSGHLASTRRVAREGKGRFFATAFVWGPGVDSGGEVGQWRATVEEWNEDTGVGRIECFDGECAEVLRRDTPTGTLLPGCVVHCDLSRRPDGSLRALRLTGPGAPPPGPEAGEEARRRAAALHQEWLSLSPNATPAPLVRALQAARGTSAVEARAGTRALGGQPVPDGGNAAPELPGM